MLIPCSHTFPRLTSAHNYIYSPNSKLTLTHSSTPENNRSMETFSSDSSSSSSSYSELNSCYKTFSSSPPKRPAGRTKFKETRHPLYKGVRQRGAAGRWVCELRDPNNNKSRIWLGTYKTAELAGRAHDFAAIALRGHSACLNFADSAWLLNVPKSFSSTKDLVKLAAKAVEDLSSSLPEMEVASPVSVDSMTSPEMDAFDVFKDGGLDFGMMQEFYYDGLLVDTTITNSNWDDVDYNADVSLWSFTF